MNVAYMAAMFDTLRDSFINQGYSEEEAGEKAYDAVLIAYSEGLLDED